MAARTITAEETGVVHELIGRARTAMRAIEGFDQATVDRLCQAVAWAGGNEQTAIRLANMSVDESGMGKRETRRARCWASSATPCARRAWASSRRIRSGLVKYAKPAV
jgi:sulfoacetaldehyde dehydrogenase